MSYNNEIKKTPISMLLKVADVTAGELMASEELGSYTPLIQSLK